MSADDYVVGRQVGGRPVSGALRGLRVVELGSAIPTAFAARLLGDLGAEVVKVEPPEGDALRDAEPIVSAGEGDREHW